MSSSIDIQVPQETVNDDYVTIVEWQVEAGGAVQAGQPLVSLETSKMVLDVEAEGDGFLEIVHPAGSEVAIGDLIGRIHAEKPAATASAPSAAPDAAAKPSTQSVPAGVKISKKAQALIDQYGIDPGVFADAGLVKEADVIKHLEKQREAPATAPAADTAPATTSTEIAKSEPAAPPATDIDYKKGLFANARAAASDRGQSLFSVAWGYFFRNWLLGNLVRWAPRGVITLLHRWRGVKMGQGCFIDPTAIVETAYPENITLGDDVRVTAGVVVMTHIKAPHYLRETGIVPPVLKPVVFEDHSFIGVNSVVMPGVTVGKAAVVASGSVVLQNVPAYTMVAGNPAKVIKQFPRPDGE